MEMLELATDLKGARAEIKRLRAELEECKRYAERYRWLRATVVRSDPDMSGNHKWFLSHPRKPLRGTTFEEAIDAALAGGE